MGWDIHFCNSPAIGKMVENDERMSFVQEEDLVSGSKHSYLRIADVGEIYLYELSDKYSGLGCIRCACISPFKDVTEYLYEKHGIYFFTDHQDQEIFHLGDYVLGKDEGLMQHAMLLEEMFQYFPSNKKLRYEYKKIEKEYYALLEKYKDAPRSPFPIPVIEESLEELIPKNDLPF